MDYLQQSNTERICEIFDDYEQALIWLNEYQYKTCIEAVALKQLLFNP